MSFKLGKGFGLFDFDGDGRLNPIEPRISPFMADDARSVMRQFLIDEAVARDLSEAGVDLAQLFTSDEEERHRLLEEAGLDPEEFDFDVEEYLSDEDDLWDELFGDDDDDEDDDDDDDE